MDFHLGYLAGEMATNVFGKRAVVVGVDPVPGRIQVASRDYEGVPNLR